MIINFSIYSHNFLIIHITLRILIYHGFIFVYILLDYITQILYKDIAISHYIILICTTYLTFKEDKNWIARCNNGCKFSLALLVVNRLIDDRHKLKKSSWRLIKYRSLNFVCKRNNLLIIIHVYKVNRMWYKRLRSLFWKKVNSFFRKRLSFLDVYRVIQDSVESRVS